MRVVLVSTYDLGRQPFGLASPAAWLREAGHEVRMLDLAVEAPDEGALRAADVIAFHLPMHAATRRALRLVPWVRGLNARARLCGFGLYAPMNARAPVPSLGTPARARLINANFSALRASVRHGCGAI